VKPWEALLRRMWALVRDVVFAGFGLWIIYREMTMPGRYALELIGVAVALTVPSAAEHLKAILPASSGESAITSSSRSSERPGSPPESRPGSSSRPGPSGEPGG
jgi:hypothetical protein